MGSGAILRPDRHGIRKIENMDMTGQKVTLAAQVLDFNPEDHIDKKEARRMDPYTQYAVAAAKIAMEDCGSDLRRPRPLQGGRDHRQRHRRPADDGRNS